ncbi:MAG: PIG-L family deacetylase [Acidobacteriota bacterium]
MTSVNPYRRLVSELERLTREAKNYPLGGFLPAPRPEPAADAPRALIFSPHPDDECIIGGLALRLQREAALHVVNVAVTQGSRKDRQAARWHELQSACDYLGFTLIQTAPGGLERVHIKTRTEDPVHWQSGVAIIAGIIQEQEPEVVFFPHDADWNSTHIGVHHLVLDALACQPASFDCSVVETEFWGAMTTPNLMVESSVDDLSEMITALSFHAGEVQRNPYHLLVPPWMQDNVRRGGELVGGQGGAAPDFTFSTLYRLRRWAEGRLSPAYAGGRIIPATMNAVRVFDLP